MVHKLEEKNPFYKVKLPFFKTENPTEVQELWQSRKNLHGSAIFIKKPIHLDRVF